MLRSESATVESRALVDVEEVRALAGPRESRENGR